jgi:hypothetical protein
VQESPLYKAWYWFVHDVPFGALYLVLLNVVYSVGVMVLLVGISNLLATHTTQFFPTVKYLQDVKHLESVYWATLLCMWLRLPDKGDSKG